MIRSTARRVLSPLSAARRAREKARGIRSDVPLPFDMFDDVRGAAEVEAAKKLEGIYHKGQRKAWSGREVLPELVAKHGGVKLSPERIQALQGLFAVILWGELAAWKVSAQLAVELEPLEAKLAATSQAHDESRHFYVMHDYLALLGPVPRALGPRTTRTLLGTLQADTLAKKLVGMQMMIEPMALALFHLVRESAVEPVLCELLALYERDEARHVALGVLHLPRLLKSMTLAETVDLYTWEFGEYWNQIEMLAELEPHFRALGIDVRRVIEIARGKQIRANQLLQEELGTPQPVYDAFIRIFDAKLDYDFPDDRSATRLERLRRAARAATRGPGVVPVELTTVAA